MPRELLYRPHAEEDFREIYFFIAADSPERARNFVREIRRRCRLLVDVPELGPARPDLGRVYEYFRSGAGSWPSTAYWMMR